MRLSRQYMKQRSGSGSTWLAATAILALALALGACGGDSTADDHQADHDAVGEEEVATDVFVVRAIEQGGSLSVELLARIQSFADVVRVEPYIRLRFADFDVIGLELGAPNRIMTGQPSPHLIEATLTEGAALSAEAAAARMVLVGRGYADAAGLKVGAVFQLEESDLELHISGIFSTEPSALSRVVVMPLELVQELFGLPGQVTHFWVTVASPAQTHDAIRSAQLALGEGVAILPRTVG